ncbi:hypothetical protein SAMN05216389_11476 [Oceanobacillus limi]|uniref:HAAS transmembrane region domain-containing protein n=1 Tax=Oceanobacillus limi TaxID=930131 RepID=A0A1I0FA04_9BACI|nr:hypothetical protein [Oceanobacillus limi]SET54761.1 hypothetical protein SAMN05216389_11476 [Oceanobacillus limi]
MNDKMNLSERSKSFLEELRVYLFSSGKNSNEIDEIVEELEAHLEEAEAKGKSIEHVVGKSPKEYMQTVSNEMDIDYRTWIKYVVLIILGSFSFSIIGDLLEGNLSYSLFEIVGHVVIIAISIAIIFSSYRYISGKNYSTMKQFSILLIPATLPFLLFLGLIYLNRSIETPIIHINTVWSITIGVITILFIIGVSIWAKSLILLVFVAFLTLPEYFLSKTTMTIQDQLIISQLITIGGIGVYLFLSMKKNYRNLN